MTGDDEPIVIDVLTAAHLTSALLAVAVTSLMVAGFIRLAWRSRGLIGLFATGIVLVHLCVLLRTVYRDVVPLFFAADAVILSAPVALAVLMVLNLLIVYAGWHGLRALHLAIPDGVRARYSVLTAALYPPFRRR